MSDSSLPSSRLLLLPVEIRFMIYEYLLHPSATPSSSHSTSVMNLLPDYHVYYSSDTKNEPFTLAVRTIDPYKGMQGRQSWRRRSMYYVRTGPFLTSTTPTTYRILLSPYTVHLRHTVPSLLLLNRQIHAEASRILYSTYTFNFHTSIESVVPFLSDRSPLSRTHVHAIQITKKALPHTKEFDRAEWTSMCEYLSRNRMLKSLSLSVVAGKPGNGGWNGIAAISRTGFEVLRQAQRELKGSIGGGEGMHLEWAEELISIRGLRQVEVRAYVEHCPTPRSEMMALWVAFSKSVEGGFRDWIRGAMIGDEESHNGMQVLINRRAGEGGAER